MSLKSAEDQLKDCGIELPVGLTVEQEIRTFQLDKNRINCYGNKKTRLGDKCYPRTQFSQKGFENEQLYMIFNTPLKGDRAREGKDGPLDVDADPNWFNTQTIGVKMDPEKKSITTWNDYLHRIKHFLRWLQNIGTIQSSVVIPMEEWNTPLFLKIKEKRTKRVSPSISSLEYQSYFQSCILLFCECSKYWFTFKMTDYFSLIKLYRQVILVKH